MSDVLAREAAAAAVYRYGTPPYARGRKWDDESEPTKRVHREIVDTALTALGIPTDATLARVSTALALLDAVETIQKHRPEAGFNVEWDAGEPDVGLRSGYCSMTDHAITGGDSMVAAVVALAARLREVEP